jgi:hypothetical protein
MHFITGGIGFLGLIAACFVFASRFRGLQQRGWAIYSAATGIVFLAAFFGIASGSQIGGTVLIVVTLAFTAAVVIAWTWISLLEIRIMKEY